MYIAVYCILAVCTVLYCTVCYLWGLSAVDAQASRALECVCRFHRIKRKQKEKEMRKELEEVGVSEEGTEPLLRQRAMVGGGLLVVCWQPSIPLQGVYVCVRTYCTYVSSVQPTSVVSGFLVPIAQCTLQSLM